MTDPAADVGSGSNNSNMDIIGTTATASSPASAAIDWYSTGTSGCFFFRMQIAASALNGSRIDNNEWIVGLGTGSTTKAWMVVNGNNSDPNNVAIYNGSVVLQKSYNFNGAGANNDYAWATSVGSKHYVYWQVPYTDLSAVLGVGTIFGFFAGTSPANSFSSINRDCLSSNCSVPDYTLSQQTDLSQNLQTAASPDITSLSVTRGITSGSTSTVISGTNLSNTSNVYFGTSQATITANTSTSITVTTPSGNIGSVGVYVVTAGGGPSNTLANAFTYYAAPTVTNAAASGITSSAATINGNINPNNDRSEEHTSELQSH